MRCLFLTSLLSWVVCSATAQWSQIDSPLALVSSLDFVKTGSQNQGFAVGRNGLFLKSDSSLVHWIKQPFPFDGNLEVVNFNNSEIGLVGGDNGFLLRTSDGGATWTTIFSGMTEQFTLIEWLGGDAVIVCTSGGKVYKSTNLGLTFSLVQTFPGKTISALVFYNALEGYIGGAPDFFMKTIDGGQTWQNISLSLSTPVRVTDISTKDGINVIVTGWYGTNSPFRKLSTNEGLFWQNFPTNPSGGFSSECIFRFKEDGAIVAFNSSSRYSITNDLGQTWTSKRCFYPNLGLFINSPSAYHVVGKKFFLASSSFFSVDLETSAIQGIRMATGYNVETGQLSSNSENLLLSQDNLFSALWRVEDQHPMFISPPGQNGYIRGGAFLDSATMLILSTSRVPNNNFYGSTLFRYHRNTGTYDSLPIPYQFIFEGIVRLFFPDSSNVYGVRANKKIVKSNDRGLNWLIDIGSIPYDQYRIVSRELWLSWQGNTLMKSKDEGLTWTDMTFGSFSDVAECFFTDSLQGIIIAGTKILKTSDGGANWTIVLANIPSQMNSGSYTTLFISPQRGFIFRGNSRYLETNDFGNTWSVKYYPFSDYLSFGSTDLKTKSAFVGCRNQTMYLLSETVILEKKKPLENVTFNLYPNPVEGLLYLNLNSSPIQLQVFRSDGKETPCESHLPGTLDCSHLSPGLYFIKARYEGKDINGRFIKR